MVNLHDFIYKETSRHGKPAKLKLYRHTCNTCGADRGYQAKSFSPKTCNKCSHLGISLPAEVKQKMSEAATKRYRDPDWQPKTKYKNFKGQRRTVYFARTSALQRQIRHQTRSLLWQKLKNHSANKSGSTFDLLGYTVNDLIKHLESQFQDGMSWDNYGKSGWEIDHRTPDSWFLYSSVEDPGFKESWALLNLQPMWHQENASKGARYAGDFRQVEER